MTINDRGMFEWCEAQRALAADMSDAEIAKFLLKDVLTSIGMAESEFACSDADSAAYNKERGVVREAAYRLARLRNYEQR